MSQLESLANELFFGIFDCLNTPHIIHAFLGLNSRLNYLLYDYFRYRQFNLQSIGRNDIEIIYQKHFPLLANNIISFHLSNDIETPNLCELLHSYGFNFNRFINLKSLSLYHIDSLEAINRILIQCRHLSYLTHLYLIECHMDKRMKNITDMINNIWSLSKLTHCIINDIKIEGSWFYNLSVVSSSIEFLTINNQIDDYVNVFHHLFQYTPHLQRLHANVMHWPIHNQSKIVFLSLIFLKTSFIGNIYSMIDFFKKFPNLCYLTLKIWDIRINGYDWEKFLVKYLPKIKNFRLKMNFKFSFNENIYDQLDRLVDSFRSRFWLEEHQWYIRCDCYFVKNNKLGVLYTLPYAFNNCSYLNIQYSKSTKPDEKDFCSHKNVHIVNQENIEINSFNDLSLFRNRFPNIRHFEITLPLIDSFHSSMNFPFNQLTYFTVRLNAILGYQHLQIILDRAHQLYTLKFCSFGGSIVELFQLTSISVRELDLIVAQVNHGAFFNNEDCINLINSPLGRECEVLRIELENSTDILDLIEKMSHLHVLVSPCSDIWKYQESLSAQKYFIRWLKQNLSAKSSIIIDPIKGSKICIWIYRKTNISQSTNNGTSSSNSTNLLHSCFPTSIRRLFH